jgi:hypothetical protein
MISTTTSAPRDPCFAVKCDKCGKTTWKVLSDLLPPSITHSSQGCGQHVDSVCGVGRYLILIIIAYAGHERRQGRGQMCLCARVEPCRALAGLGACLAAGAHNHSRTHYPMQKSRAVPTMNVLSLSPLSNLLPLFFPRRRPHPTSGMQGSALISPVGLLLPVVSAMGPGRQVCPQSPRVPPLFICCHHACPRNYCSLAQRR